MRWIVNSECLVGRCCSLDALLWCCGSPDVMSCSLGIDDYILGVDILSIGLTIITLMLILNI